MTHPVVAVTVLSTCAVCLAWLAIVTIEHTRARDDLRAGIRREQHAREALWACEQACVGQEWQCRAFPYRRVVCE